MTIHQWLQHQDAGTILALALVTSIVVLYLGCRALSAIEAIEAIESQPEPEPVRIESDIPPVVVNLGILASRCERAATHPNLNNWERISLKLQAETYRHAQLHFLENPQWLEEAEPTDKAFAEESARCAIL